MAASPVVSVVIPTYSRTEFLAEALDSVMAQTFQDFEVIVVEDGSHAAEDIVRPYGDRVRYLRQPNHGPAAARNHGARLASGHWIAFLDDDDVWLPEKLERQLSLIEHFPGLGMVHTDCYVLADGQIGPSRRPVPAHAVPSGWIGPALFLRNLVWTSSTLILKAAFDRTGGFDTRIRRAEDYHLWIRLAQHCPFGFLSEPLWIYRIHGGGLTTDDRLMALGNVTALESALREMPALWRECGHEAVRTRLHAFRLECALLHFYAGMYAAARTHFLGAWRWRPSDLRSLAYAAACSGGSGGIETLRNIKRIVRALRPAA